MNGYERSACTRALMLVSLSSGAGCICCSHPSTPDCSRHPHPHDTLAVVLPRTGCRRQAYAEQRHPEENTNAAAGSVRSLPRNLSRKTAVRSLAVVFCLGSTGCSAAMLLQALNHALLPTRVKSICQFATYPPQVQGNGSSYLSPDHGVLC